MEKTSKHDEYVSVVEKFAVYVDTKTKTVGIYCTNEDMLKAEKKQGFEKIKNIV